MSPIDTGKSWVTKGLTWCDIKGGTLPGWLAQGRTDGSKAELMAQGRVIWQSHIGCSSLVMQSLAPLGNGGDRKILGVGPSFNVSSELQRVQSEFNVCVQSYYCKSLVSLIGHCFRHPSRPVTKLMSLPISRKVRFSKAFETSGSIWLRSVSQSIFGKSRHSCE